MNILTDSAEIISATREESHRGQRGAAYAATALEGVIAFAAFGGGAAMVADPSGAMGLSPEMLDRLPVDSWLLPGVALIACNGLLPTAVAAAEWRGRRWPRRFGHLIAGAVLLAWPVTETLLFGYPLPGEPVWLRPGVAAVGLALVSLGVQLRRTTAPGRTARCDGGDINKSRWSGLGSGTL